MTYNIGFDNYLSDLGYSTISVTPYVHYLCFYRKDMNGREIKIHNFLQWHIECISLSLFSIFRGVYHKGRRGCGDYCGISCL